MEPHTYTLIEFAVTRGYPVPSERGHLDEQRRTLSSAERHAVELWLITGHDVEALAPSNAPGVKTADVLVDEVPWEIKSPVGAASHTIPDNIRHGRKQARRVLIDVRNSGLSHQRAEAGLAEAKRKYHEDIDEIWIVGEGFGLRWLREE
jgi:hypothetical protein